MMTDDSPSANGELQFDRVIAESSVSPASGTLAVLCSFCHASIGTEYYHINGNIFCSRCRAAIESAAETSQGVAPLAIAGLFGLGAGIVGAVIYFAVMAIAHLEIGIVAILIGYMVGYAIRKGTRGRGGLRFQILAAALTYLSVALAYSPIAMSMIARSAQQAQASNANGTNGELTTPAASRASTEKPTPGAVLVAIVFLLAVIAVLPVFVAVASFPTGLISLVIIFIGMRQAWRMTRAPWLEILGPYRVGAAPASVLA
jgi:hypothetical protein